jgi:dihydrodipicolinate synthase/N-acetylneuraminate lyase
MERETTISRLRGCYLALPTLFKDDLSLNLAGMRRHVRFLVDHGLHEGNGVLLVNGANGEFPMLTLEERKQTAEAVVDVANNRIAVIVGAQTSSTREAIQIAQHAQEIGAAALQVSPPYYFTPTDDDVYEHVAAIAAAAPQIGIVFYTTYWLGYKSTPATLERLAEIPQVACIKWGSPDPFNYQFVLLRLADKLGIIDNQLSPVYNQMMGGSGVNVHPALLWPEWGVKVWELLEARAWDRAQAEVARVLLPYYEIIGDIAQTHSGEGNIEKLGLELLGMDGGPSRPPMRPLPPVYKERLRQFCHRVGLPLQPRS